MTKAQVRGDKGTSNRCPRHKSQVIKAQKAVGEKQEYLVVSVLERVAGGNNLRDEM